MIGEVGTDEYMWALSHWSESLSTRTRWPMGAQPQRKGQSMNIRAILCAASLAVMTITGQTAVAQSGLKVGALRCDVSGGLGLIITSSKDMRCVFTSVRGYQERYYGRIRQFGLDIGATDQGVLVWDVFAPSEGPKHGALAGNYVGVDASATIGAGLGANVLVGGSHRSFTLQPLSIEAQTGLALAAGVASMTLRPGR
jgi:hypothetical protein